MKFIALKELPQGQQPGEVFETTPEMGDALILVGAARLADPDPKSPEVSSTRRRYQRRDLEAEG